MQAAFSYVSGASDEPLLGLTIGQALELAAERWPDRPALISPSHGVAWTWRELRERVAKPRRRFRQSSACKRGERIGVWSLNRPEWTLTQFAAAEAGLVFVTINPAYRLHELEYALKKVGCAALVVATRFKTQRLHRHGQRARARTRRRPSPARSRRRSCPTCASSSRSARQAPGTLAFEEVGKLGGETERAALAAMRDEIQFDDAANIQFTSGTTGSPKGVTLSHHNILNNGYFIGRAMQLHAGGSHLHSGAALSLLRHGDGQSRRRDARRGDGLSRRGLRSAGDAEDDRVRALHRALRRADDVHRRARSSRVRRFDLASLRTGIMAGAPCPIAVMRKVLERMHMRDVTIAYGMTETSPVSFQSSTEDSIERRVTTIGRVHPHVEVKIVDQQGPHRPARRSPANCARAAIP